MTDPTVQLWHFCHSNYNEKVRWALDLKSIPHHRVPLLPGPHRAALKRLTGGHLTPTVRIGDGEPMDESTAIVEALEARWPEPRLLPDDPALRADILAEVARLDLALGADSRQTFLGLAFRSARFGAAGYTASHGRFARAAFRAVFPGVRRVIASIYELTPDKVDAARERFDAELASIGARVADGGYLLGDRFSLADLTAACHIGLGLGPKPNAMPVPARPPAGLEAWWEATRATDAGRWALGLFERHRPPDGCAAV